MPTLLAFDTATEQTHIGLAVGDRVLMHRAQGGTQASATLIPAVMSLLQEAGICIGDLDAIAFGRGPGAFTGLRTACSVAQGLAYGAQLPVIAIDTLMAVAEDAGGDRVAVAVDARMNEIYTAEYRRRGDGWVTTFDPMLASVDFLNEHWRRDPPQVLAGNASRVFPGLQCGDARQAADAEPSARALLALARWHWQRGDRLDAAQALPMYVRDKVAQTTEEREAARRAKEAAA